MNFCCGVSGVQKGQLCRALTSSWALWALIALLLGGCASLDIDPISMPLPPERTMAPPGVDPQLQRLFADEDRYLLNRGRATPPNTKDGADGIRMLFSEILSPRSTDGNIPVVKDENIPLFLRYLLGRGVDQDAAEGIRLMEIADETGSLYVTCNLAQIYDAGIQTTQNQPRALALYKKCLPQDPTKAVRIGEMYEMGLGTDVDYKRALHYYLLATTTHMSLGPSIFPFSWHDGWHVEAEYKIGRLYAMGKGVPRHYREAAGWFIRASQYGKRFGNDSEFSGLTGIRTRCALAIMYANGLGVTKNPSTAMMWRNLSGVKAIAPCDTLAPQW